MLNKKRINLMTKLAIYDQEKGINDKKIYKYYKADFIGKNILFNNTILAFFIFIFFLLKYLYYIVMNNEIWSLELLKETGINYLTWSIVIIILYTLYNIYIYNNEYNKAKSNLDTYYKAIDKLNNMKQT